MSPTAITRSSAAINAARSLTSASASPPGTAWSRPPAWWHWVNSCRMSPGCRAMNCQPKLCELLASSMASQWPSGTQRRSRSSGVCPARQAMPTLRPGPNGASRSRQAATRARIGLQVVRSPGEAPQIGLEILGQIAQRSLHVDRQAGRRPPEVFAAPGHAKHPGGRQRPRQQCRPARLAGYHHLSRLRDQIGQARGQQDFLFQRLLAVYQDRPARQRRTVPEWLREESRRGHCRHSASESDIPASRWPGRPIPDRPRRGSCGRRRSADRSSAPARTGAGFVGAICCWSTRPRLFRTGTLPESRASAGDRALGFAQSGLALLPLGQQLEHAQILGFVVGRGLQAGNRFVHASQPLQGLGSRAAGQQVAGPQRERCVAGRRAALARPSSSSSRASPLMGLGNRSVQPDRLADRRRVSSGR